MLAPSEILKEVAVLGGELAVSASPQDALVAHALGSCIGVAVHDSVLAIGGMAHIQHPAKLPHSPRGRSSWCSADLAVSELIRRVLALGANKRRLRVIIAG